jgi:transposase
MRQYYCTRLEEFRQFRNEIRGSGDYLIVGIDVSKERHHAFFGTGTGKTLIRGLIFGNSCEGFQKLLGKVEMIKVQHCLPKVVFGMEPTGNYHKPLGEHLIKCGHMVVLVSPSAARNNRELLDGRWDKNDTKDSANIADIIAQGKCLYYEYPEESLRNLRSLLSLRRRLKKQQQRIQLSIRNQLLAQYFPEMDRHFGTTVSLSVVHSCLNPAIIAGMEYDEFRRTVFPGKLNTAQQKRLQAIWQAAPESIGCDVGEAVSIESEVMVTELHQVRQTLKMIEQKIEEVCLQYPGYSYLLSIPGFGPDISAKVLGAIGDPERFTNAKQVLKLAGFDLSANRSGKTSQNVTPVISKKGKADLRYALYQAAMVASSMNKDFMVYFTDKLKGRQREKGIGAKMRVKLAAKLLVIAWTLMKKNEPFNAEYLNKEDN